MASPMPPLPGAGPTNMMGGVGGGGMGADPNAMPPSAPPPSPGALGLLESVNNILKATKAIKEAVPTTILETDQIDNLVNQIQVKIIGAMPPTPVQAPPY